MDPINDDEFDDDTITAEDLTPLHSAPEGEGASAPPPEAVADPGEDDPDSPPPPEAQDGKRSEVVPHAKFHAANERAKQERMARENAERRLDAILQAVNAQRAPQQAQQPEPPVDPDPMPPEDDIVALAQWNARQIVRQREERQQWEQRSQQERQSIELGTRVKTAAQQDFAAYAAEDPSIQDAYNVVARSRGMELMALGYSREQAEAAFQQEELNLYHAALQRGQRPSQAIIAMARARGWQPGAQAAPGAAPQPGAQAPETPQAAPNADRRALHTSLSSVSGGEAPRALTAKDLLAMDEDEFARVSDSVVNKLMKGNAA